MALVTFTEEIFNGKHSFLCSELFAKWLSLLLNICTHKLQFKPAFVITNQGKVREKIGKRIGTSIKNWEKCITDLTNLYKLG